jgi:hypothetical protein
MDAFTAWDRLKDMKLADVKVGVIDTGFVGGSGDINFTKLYGPSGVQSNDAAAPPNISATDKKTGLDQQRNRHHGMHVAGIIAASGDNGKLVTGLAYQATLNLHVARWDSVGSVMAHIARLARDNVKVINLSVGFAAASSANLESSRTFAKLTHSLLKRKDFLLVIAAGNGDENQNGIVTSDEAFLGGIFTTPQCLGLDVAECETVKNHVLHVGAIGSWNKDYTWPPLASYSNYGQAVEIVAPGGDKPCARADKVGEVDSYSQNSYVTPLLYGPCLGIASLGADGERVLSSGTSMAAPFVTGTVALMMAVNSKISAKRVKELLILSSYKSSNRIGSNGEKYPILSVNRAVRMAADEETGIETPTNPDPSRAVVVLSILCQVMKNDLGNEEPRMIGMKGILVDIKFLTNTGEYENIFSKLTVDGVIVAYLPKGDYKLSTNATPANPTATDRNFSINPALNDSIRNLDIVLRGVQTKDCVNSTEAEIQSVTVDDSPVAKLVTSLDAVLSQGFGESDNSNGSCSPGNLGCTVEAVVHLTKGSAGRWFEERWASANGSAFVLGNQTSKGWVLEDSGWTTRLLSGAYTTQADGSFLVTGGGFGSAGASGQLRMGDLSGRPMSEAGETGAAATALFPANSQGLWWTFYNPLDTYQLRETPQLSGSSSLTAMVATLQTPAAGNPLGNRWGWSGTQFTFDGALSTTGTLSFWSAANTLLGKGSYELRSVKGQQILVVTQVPSAAITDVAQRDGGIVEQYRNRERPIFAVLNGAVLSGSTTGAGTTVDTRPSLNRPGLDALLTARGLCTLPDANGNSVCLPFAVRSVTPAAFTLGQVSTITVIGVSVPGTAVLALADAICGQPYGHNGNSFRQDCTPQAAGSKTLIVKNQPGGAIAFSATVSVGTGAFTVSAVTPTSFTLGQSSTIRVTGSGVPGTAVLALADAICGSPYGHTATSFQQDCTPQAAGSKTLTVKDQPGGSVAYTTTVSVQ